MRVINRVNIHFFATCYRVLSLKLAWLIRLLHKNHIKLRTCGLEMSLGLINEPSLVIPSWHQVFPLFSLSSTPQENVQTLKYKMEIE